MSEMKYSPNKWKNIMDTTQNNYANMIKRLTRRSKISNFVLIYYSIFLIICSLTCKFFPNNFNSTLAEYFNIILSIIILAYSLVNNSSNYTVRIARIEKSLNGVKNIKRKLCDDKDKLELCIKEYIEITDRTERREDIDFFITTKELCKKYGVYWISGNIKKNTQSDDKEDETAITSVRDHLSEISIFYEIVKLMLEYLWYVFLIVTPIIVFYSCIVFK